MWSRASALLVAAVYSALAVLWTWPLGAYLGSRIPNDPGDPVLNTYLLWWNANSVPFTAVWWNPPFFVPLPDALALSEHLAGLWVISTPVQLLGGGAVLAYNVAFIASYALSAWFAYLLTYRLTGSAAASFCGGLAFGFAPFRAAQLGHLQVLTSQWLPLQLLAMHAYLDTGRRRWLLVCGAAWLLQGLSNGYYLLYAPVLLALWMLWFPRWRGMPRRSAALAAACVAASLPFVPILLKYREVHQSLGLGRGLAEIVDFSATPASYLQPPRSLALWPPRTAYATEADLFPGVTVPVVIAVGMLVALMRGRVRSLMRDRSPLAFYSVAALVMVALTFGPGAADSGAARWLRPYFWLTLLPGFDSVRVPARYAMLAALCAAIAAGLCVRRLLPEGRVRRALVAAAIAIGIAADGWMLPVPLVATPGRLFLEGISPDAAVLELPADDRTVNLNAMYRSMFHRRPLINGHSGYVPRHFAILGQSMRAGDPSAILELARGRPLALVVNESFDPSRDLRRMVESIPGVTSAGSGNAGALYVLQAQPRRRVDRSGVPLPASASMLPRAHAVFDLGQVRPVRTVEFPIGGSYVDYRRIAVETSTDGHTWRTAWEDWIGGLALQGALDDARAVPVRIPLRDVEARYIRIHPLAEWMVRELRIAGP